MLAWLKSLWQSFRNWCRENERAHRDAPLSPCCSKPPAAVRHSPTRKV
ncbi:hypothetical protein Tchl_0176 [Thauera chlorobenzoica]|uniref:Uncharacterized protein n=1 Tax=Thauera chlorobenzoica TaxID=96773 RepID=A0A1L6F810_9RHOO|nr:hypothetical protein Tchl_0176 [Thauera chlorobenzoica]